MPMLIDGESRAEVLTRAINHILLESGPAGLTIRRISAMSGVSHASIYHQMGNREHLLRVAAGWTGRARTSSLRVASKRHGALGFVPGDEEELFDARVWLAWLELWRCEDFLGRWVEESRSEERGLLAAVTEHQLARPELDALLALIDGLRVAVCAPHAPMGMEVARQVLADRLREITPGCHTQAFLGVAPSGPRSGR